VGDYKCVMMKPNDNVAVALMDIPQHSVVHVECQDYRITLSLIQPIEFGHKFAVKEISKGNDILKYGEVIGAATSNIRVGEHVHVHNVEGKRGRGDISV